MAVCVRSRGARTVSWLLFLFFWCVCVGKWTRIKRCLIELRWVLCRSLIDSPLVEALRNGRSFVEYYGKDPKRCLDLGTAVRRGAFE